MEITQRMKLTEKLMDDVIGGRKTRTIRKGPREVTVGGWLTFVDEANNRARSVSVIAARIVRLESLNDEDAKLDGFKDVSDMLAGLRKFYPDLSKRDLVTVIDFV